MQISYEYTVEQDPNVIFVLERSTAISTNDRSSNASSFDKNPLIQQITAYQNNQIHYLTPDSWYLSNRGVQAYKQMIADVATVFE
ncbi:ABC transporter substrate-binding protein [Fundicoccus sp. Sow4_H7]|uniref:ABC transporter substrate-binding protein n=1 Tax=Fundicoccus sp. Sow4_H7 TaxID=3438784 RepID=UPI003F90EF3D